MSLKLANEKKRRGDLEDKFAALSGKYNALFMEYQSLKSQGSASSSSSVSQVEQPVFDVSPALPVPGEESDDLIVDGVVILENLGQTVGTYPPTKLQKFTELLLGIRANEEKIASLEDKLSGYHRQHDNEIMEITTQQLAFLQSTDMSAEEKQELFPEYDLSTKGAIAKVESSWERINRTFQTEIDELKIKKVDLVDELKKLIVTPNEVFIPKPAFEDDPAHQSGIRVHAAVTRTTKAWEALNLPTVAPNVAHLSNKVSMATYKELKSQYAININQKVPRKYRAVYRVAGDGDCAYRAILMGLLYNAKFRADGISRFRKIMDLLNQKNFKQEYPKAEAEVLREAAKLLHFLMADLEFSPFETVVELLDNPAVSQSLIFLLRHITAMVFSGLPNEYREYSELSVGAITKMGEYASLEEVSILVGFLQFNKEVYDVESGYTEIPDPKAQLPHQFTIALIYANWHFDLLVESWTDEDKQRFEKRAQQGLEDAARIAQQNE